MNDTEQDQEEFAAFVRDETESTYRFLWNGIKAGLILVGSVVLAGAIAITVWQVTR